jgi:hypothetical protein
MNKQKYDVYISYNNADQMEVEHLARALSKSLNVWLDRWALIPGQPWQEQIEEALQSSKSVLVFVGPKGIGPWQNEESAVALSRRFTDPSFRVIPVIGPGADIKKIPSFLARVTWVDLRSKEPQKVTHAVDLIVKAVKGVKGQQVERASPRIFLCHAKEDATRIEELYFALGKAGLDPWYDKKKLSVGDHWETEIMQAIERSDFFAACLSITAVKKTGYIQKEIRTAVREYQRRPQGIAYLLPIRLEECELPKIKLDDTTTLTDLQWIDIFADDEQAVKDLIASIWKQWRKARGEDW